MLKGFIILISWIIFGFSIDYIIAKLNYVENSSMYIKGTWLTVGIYASLFHCIFIKKKDKKLNYAALLPSIVLVFFMSWHFIELYIVEYNCSISEPDSLLAAVDYVKKIQYDTKYLDKKPFKLEWCKLGFEYSSPDSYRLVIVSDDGSVKLND